MTPKRTLADIRENLDYVGCDNDTARELCAEIERLIIERNEARTIAQTLLKDYVDFDTERKLIDQYPWIDYNEPENPFEGAMKQ